MTGTLSIVVEDQLSEAWCQWEPASEHLEVQSNSDITLRSYFKTCPLLQAGSDYEFKARVAEIHSVKVIRCNIGYQQLILNLQTGCSPPPFFFQNGNIMEFRQTLAEVCHLNS
jgi:hypothetical protein